MNPYSTANAYKQVEVKTTNRLKLVVMIYDSAIASLKQANESHKRNDITKRNQFISRAQFIINELNNSLDLQQGKEISESLRKIYHFLNRNLNNVFADNDIKKVGDSLEILINLREAWDHISKEAGAGTNSILSSGHGAAVYHQQESVKKSTTY